ncbi:PREDICTED: nucleoplasmin-like protein ANO39 [Nicrophorus vespilloides]|uniref:Nucleoplasmin-like protein ANO39 n=1 Tax=Nicrophorus vespilloides TaxID=110193 RepID=A0ABM1N6A5_NICVS|nr:PREDICTED: nucleoplasmin-like protein ANO39 [Nicrophorus vespilloides]XP_017782354.1 PREDICTED: nucleoplasmin-like protein ANO39 [Nicrophorus vespilloides]XP_017782355.1 PREDICTED: nucleoplasmin-like protein ANO39 [Nicrophorus vespilloides]
MAAEDNGNVGLLKPTSSSNEDLSEYTDADESISAPTEFLAEFLSAVMLKDYETALKYCKLILQYEPNNVTAKEFYPLILEKLQMMNDEEDANNESDEDENDVSSSSGSNSNSSTTNSDSDASSSDDSSEDQEEEDEEGEEEDEEGIEGAHGGGGGGQGGTDKRSKGSSDGGDATTGSYSSLEDDEAEVDQLAALAAKYQMDNMDIGNGNNLYSGEIKTTTMIGVCKKMITTNALCSESPPPLLPFGTSSDSESPTEPVSQQTIAMLRAKVVPTKM